MNTITENFEFKHVKDGVEYTLWYSRSVAAGMFVFAKNREGIWHILACRRGNGAGSNNGKWNCPGGFIDFNETILEGAVRECYEETGLMIDKEDIDIVDIESTPWPNTRQTIGFKFYTIHRYMVEQLQEQLSFANNEYCECDEITFIPIYDVDNYKWAFNHAKAIKQIYETYINPTFATKINRTYNEIKKIWKRKKIYK